jgi:hypothetical protein
VKVKYRKAAVITTSILGLSFQLYRPQRVVAEAVKVIAVVEKENAFVVL